VLDKYVLTSNECSKETKALTDVKQWVKTPDRACPLIVFNNASRDVNNLSMSKAFAAETGQEYNEYHSKDMIG
jgi:hypothetical protein